MEYKWLRACQAIPNVSCGKRKPHKSVEFVSNVPLPGRPSSQPANLLKDHADRPSQEWSQFALAAQEFPPMATDRDWLAAAKPNSAQAEASGKLCLRSPDCIENLWVPDSLGAQSFQLDCRVPFWSNRLDFVRGLRVTEGLITPRRIPLKMIRKAYGN